MSPHTSELGAKRIRMRDGASVLAYVAAFDIPPTFPSLASGIPSRRTRRSLVPGIPSTQLSYLETYASSLGNNLDTHTDCSPHV